MGRKPTNVLRTAKSRHIKNLPGHAFVSFSAERPGAKRDFLALGHTIAGQVSPAQAAWSYVAIQSPG